MSNSRLSISKSRSAVNISSNQSQAKISDAKYSKAVTGSSIYNSLKNSISIHERLHQQKLGHTKDFVMKVAMENK